MSVWPSSFDTSAVAQFRLNILFNTSNWIIRTSRPAEMWQQPPTHCLTHVKTWENWYGYVTHGVNRKTSTEQQKEKKNIQNESLQWPRMCRQPDTIHCPFTFFPHSACLRLCKWWVLSHVYVGVCVCVRPANDSRSRYRNSKQKTLGKENVRIWEMRTGDDTIIMKYETTQSPPPPPSLSFMLSPSESATSPVRPFPSMLGIWLGDSGKIFARLELL